jgi:acetyltransferase-like isoleucine patch superfamily enzyme
MVVPRSSETESIRIGDRFYLASRPVASHLITGTRGTLSIGDDVAIGHGAAIAAYAGYRHRCRDSYRPERHHHRHGFSRGRRPARVRRDSPHHGGRNVRIGSRVTVLRGSQHSATAPGFAAGSVVSRGDLGRGSRFRRAGSCARACRAAARIAKHWPKWSCARSAWPALPARR